VTLLVTIQVFAYFTSIMRQAKAFLTQYQEPVKT